MDTVSTKQLIVPIQNHRVTKQLFNELAEAAKTLSVPSKGGAIFNQISTKLNGLSPQQKIEQLENAYSKYDALLIELRKPILLEGVTFSVQQKAYIQNNVEEITRAIQEELRGLNSPSTQQHRFVPASSIRPPQPSNAQLSNIVLDANGKRYTTLAEVHDGYCGDKAVSELTHTRYDITESRKRLAAIREAQQVFAPKVEEVDRHENSISDFTPLARFNALKTIIPNFTVCKNYAQSFIKARLGAEGVQNVQDSQTKAKIFNESQSYDGLWRAYCRTVENPNEDHEAFNDFFMTSLPAGFEISENVDQPNEYLIEGEIQALMLDQGYVFSHNVLPEDGTDAVPGAYTVLVFKHLVDGTEKHIACDSSPLSQNQMGKQNEGSHYIAVVPA